MTMKRWLVGLLAVATLSGASAQQYLRIGTGGTAGTYYPIGMLVASVVSQPGKVFVTAQPSNGSLGNVIGVSTGSVESGFSQSDVAFWAYSGTGIFEGKPRLSNLRLIANLYPETIHLIVRKGLGVKSVADLAGKRVALDEPGSGSLVSARLVLKAFGLTEADLKAEYIKPGQAADKLLDGRLDAFFLTAGAPVKAVSNLVSENANIELIPIDGPAVDRLRAANPFLIPETIAANTYPGLGPVQTLAVGAQWVTNESVSADLIYEVTKSLYTKSAQQALATGHAKGRHITLGNALNGAALPLHPGAQRYFKEAGVLNQ
jgi:uncharacterized protein